MAHRRTHNYPHVRRQATVRAEKEQHMNADAHFPTSLEIVDYKHLWEQARAERDAACQEIKDIVLALMRVGGKLMLRRYVGPVQWAQVVAEEYTRVTTELDAARAECERLRAALQQAGTLLEALRLDNGVGLSLSLSERETYLLVVEQITAALTAPGGAEGETPNG